MNFNKLLLRMAIPSMGLFIMMACNKDDDCDEANRIVNQFQSKLETNASQGDWAQYNALLQQRNDLLRNLDCEGLDHYLDQDYHD